MTSELPPNSTTRPAESHGPALVWPRDGRATLADCLRHAAAEHPQHGLVFVDHAGNESFLSYPALVERAEKTLLGLRSRGLKPGDPVLLLPQNTEPFVTSFWACVLGGMWPVPLPSPKLSADRSDNSEDLEWQRLDRVWQRLDTAPLIAAEPWVSVARRRHGARSIRAWQPGELLAEQRATDWHVAQPNDTVLLLYSSGSTSEPKGVVVSHRHVLANVLATCQHNQFDASDATLCWAPLYHVIGLMCFHLLPVVTGAKQVIFEPLTLVQRPELWFEKIDAHRVAFTGGPNFAYAQAPSRVDRARLSEWDLSCLKVLLNGGEVVSVEVLRRFETFFAPAGLKSQAIASLWHVGSNRRHCLSTTVATASAISNRPTSVPPISRDSAYRRPER